MARFLTVFSLVVLAVGLRCGEAVRCWTCSSDIDPHCDDPFQAGQPLNIHRYHLTNCDANAGVYSYPYYGNTKSVCKKQKQYVNGEMVIIRGCTWKQADNYDGFCPLAQQPNNIRVAYCEVCERDGCNGAPTVAFSLALLAAPMALLALFK